MSEFDSPWKEALEWFLAAFLEFFFPEIHRDIDWSRGYEALDKELEKIVREAPTKKRLADKLFKVWRKNGQETWVAVHVEVQAQKDEEFPKRMHTYNYRIYDRFGRPVASLAVLGDNDPSWRPTGYHIEIWGCRSSLEFRTAKLLDFAPHQEFLEATPNPFGLIVLAHLQSQATQDDTVGRYGWKVRLLKGLLNKGYSAEEVRQLLRLIDWFLDLPAVLEQQCRQELHDYAEEKKMPYLSNIERMATEKGLAEGLAQGLAQGRTEGQREELLAVIALLLPKKFGDEGAQLLSAIRALTDPDQLRSIQQALLLDQSLEEIRQLLPRP